MDNYAIPHGGIGQDAQPQYAHQPDLHADQHGINRRIPLICSICPKASRFSDISHLLTHLSSKGHIHHHWVLKLKRSFDREVAQSLSIFDEWYNSNGIEALLCARISSKDPELKNEEPAPRGGASIRGRGSRGGRGGNRNGRGESSRTRGGRGSRGGRGASARSRAGRAGRAGRGGHSSVLVSETRPTAHLPASLLLVYFLPIDLASTMIVKI